MQSQLLSDWLWLLILGAYFTVSTFFLCFPNILHRRKQYSFDMFNKIIESKQVLCVGHRGASYQHPENTIQGFIESQKVCDILQMDVCGTKDGFLVNNHDSNLLRTTGVNKEISQLNYHELPTFLDQYIPYCADFYLKTKRNKIPLVEDVFKRFPSMPMVIELKTPILKITGQHQYEDWPIYELNRLIKKYKRQNITIWGTQKGQDNQKMYQLNKQIANFYSASQVTKVFILFLLGLLPFACLRQGFILLPLVSNVMRKELQSDSGCLKCLKMGFYHFFNFCARFFLPHLQKRGIVDMFFTVNQRQQFQSAVQIGCKGIVTDRPTDLMKYLKSQGLEYEAGNRLL